MLEKHSELVRIEARSHRHNIRLNQAELELIHQFAVRARMTVTEYIRSCAIKETGRITVETRSKLQRRQTYLELVKLQRELKCQGNNLNQITKAIHEANLKRVVVEGYVERIDAIGEANRGILIELKNMCEQILDET